MNPNNFVVISACSKILRILTMFCQKKNFVLPPSSTCPRNLYYYITLALSKSKKKGNGCFVFAILTAPRQIKRTTDIFYSKAISVYN